MVQVPLLLEHLISHLVEPPNTLLPTIIITLNFLWDVPPRDRLLILLSSSLNVLIVEQ